MESESSSPLRAQEDPLPTLPLELTSFVGREQEITEVSGLLANTRLLTLTGPGGCGKTRLALAVAHVVREPAVEGLKDGVWWVGLASLSDPDLVLQAVASVLGVRETPSRSLTEALVEHLKPNRALLFSFELWRVAWCCSRHFVDLLSRHSHPKLWCVRRPGSSKNLMNGLQALARVAG